MQYDFVLRGFCKKCEWPIYLWDMNEAYLPRYIEYVDENINTHMNPFEIHIIEPVWFLSASQERVIVHSKEYLRWVITEAPIVPFHEDLVFIFLEKNPFLVAKILKEAGEKNKEENK